MTSLKGKQIVVGLCGGIAVYKVCQLIRELRQAGGEVRVILTRGGERLIRPLMLEALSGAPVETDSRVGGMGQVSVMDEEPSAGGFAHIDLARWGDVVVVAPATANILGKVTAGIADDLLTTTILATQAPVLFCPSMNTQMYLNPAVQKNLGRLRELGYHALEPGHGRLACGEVGPGRLPEVEILLEEVEQLVSGTQGLVGWRVLVTAGPTREALDPVRYLTNPASGRMGFALARAAARWGGEVALVGGPTRLRPPRHVAWVPVRTASEMAQAVLDHLPAVDLLLMAAAVTDLRFPQPSARKLKKRELPEVLAVEPTPDILRLVAQEKRPATVVVGFAVETEDLLENARQKLVQKDLDAIVVNNPLVEGAGFGGETNRVIILSRSGEHVELPLQSKDEVAQGILETLQRWGLFRAAREVVST